MLLLLKNPAQVASLPTTPLYDDFTDPLGQWVGYDTYDDSQRTQLALQKHVNVRSFEQNAIVAAYMMFDLDPLEIGQIEGDTMAVLEDAVTISPGESWSAGTVGAQGDRKNFNGISLSCAAGTTTTTSVTTAVDISQFTSPDYISLSLPALPLASLTTSQCFLDFTSEPSGNFTTGPTDSIAFSSSTTTLTAGDSEARFPIGLFTHIALSAITGVRFRIVATGNCTFRCLAIRAIASVWKYAPVDQNTMYDRIEATVPPTASNTQSFTFPGALPPVTPFDWPIMLKSNGRSGPTLVELQVGAVIQTGLNTALNTFTLYLREMALISESMGVLQGTTMTSIAAIGAMPGTVVGRLDDFANTQYVTVRVQWGTSGSVNVRDQAGNGYTLSLSLGTQTRYYLFVRLENTSLRVQIYPVSNLGVIDWSTVVFDSTRIIDTTLLRRRQGRYGWYAQLNEGNTYVRALRPRRAVYGEYRSNPLVSHTPVVGAQVYPICSPDVELYDGLTASSGATVALDSTKSTSGRSVRVQCTGIADYEGIVTSPIRFENLFDTDLVFDVLSPTDDLVAFLQGEGRLYQHSLPPLVPNHWTHIEISLNRIAPTAMPGVYSFFIVQSQNLQSTWYLDNLSIPTRAVCWQGRGQAADPWRMNRPHWIKFGRVINDQTGGALLGRGNTLQVRGEILSPTATIDSVRIVPKYAELGNLVWTDDAPTYDAAPVAAFAVTTGSSHSVRLDASASTASDGINGYWWSFGDDNYAFGQIVNHVYASGGSYTVTLTVFDTLAQKTATSQTVSV